MAVEPNSRRESVTGEQSDTDDEAFDRDELFHLLQNERRRRALDYLRGCDGPVRMRDIVDHVAAAEHDTTPEALRSDERKRVHIALYQSHLPKLDQAGVLDYDQDRGVVTRTDRAEELDRFLAVGAVADAEPESVDAAGAYPGDEAAAPEDSTAEDGWYRYYLVLAGLSLLLLAGGIAVGGTAATTVAVTVVIAFATLAGLQWADVKGLR
jgi:hypothetical protein